MAIWRITLAILIMISFAALGCDTGTKEKKDDKKQVKEDEHFHVHGPHAGGECFRFEGNSDIAAEVVTQGQNDVVRVMFTDHDGKKKINVAATKMTLKRSKADETVFELTPIKAGEDGKVSGFELEDKKLKEASRLAMFATVTVEGKEFTGETHPPH